ncbi:hypothetical protein CLOM_g21617 [Closterium sp. NIES-68]|nr:hypothetical protein CLOM_g21617 [Closterium sp. NIES-68]GJP72937.1 hypothetical protein CLOP_g3705 [Closterium sp. NIES-67]
MASVDPPIRSVPNPAERPVTSLTGVDAALESHPPSESRLANQRLPLESPTRDDDDVCPICLTSFADSRLHPSQLSANAEVAGHPSQRCSDEGPIAQRRRSVIGESELGGGNRTLPPSAASPSASSRVGTLSPVVALSPCLHRFCLPCIRQWSTTSRSCPLCKCTFSGWWLPPPAAAAAAAAAATNRDADNGDNGECVTNEPEQGAMESRGVLHSLPPLQMPQDGGGSSGWWWEREEREDGQVREEGEEREEIGEGMDGTAGRRSLFVRSSVSTSTVTPARVTFSEGLDARLREEAVSRGVPEWVLLPDWSAGNDRQQGQERQHGQQREQGRPAGAFQGSEQQGSQGGGSQAQGNEQQGSGRWNMHRRRARERRARQRQQQQQHHHHQQQQHHHHQQQQHQQQQQRCAQHRRQQIRRHHAQQLSPYSLRVQRHMQSNYQ